ncbi:TPA: hypothetical protein I2T40_09540 [Staphylococcus aureus]|nr:hypothetical protein [Staphylococcus aureus]
MAIKIVYLLYQDNKQPNSIVMLHNHPGQSGFSLNDLAVFTINNSIKTMTGNNNLIMYTSDCLNMYNF